MRAYDPNLEVSDDLLRRSIGAFWMLHIKILLERLQSLSLPTNPAQVLTWNPILETVPGRRREMKWTAGRKGKSDEGVVKGGGRGEGTSGHK